MYAPTVTTPQSAAVPGAGLFSQVIRTGEWIVTGATSRIPAPMRPVPGAVKIVRLKGAVRYSHSNGAPLAVVEKLLQAEHQAGADSLLQAMIAEALQARAEALLHQDHALTAIQGAGLVVLRAAICSKITAGRKAPAL